MTTATLSEWDTKLIEAATHGEFAAVKEALAKGANINARDSDGSSSADGLRNAGR